jgi:predicted TIM-barrel fold metal-dependent hydrolase
VDFQQLKDMVPRSHVAEARDMMWRDAERFTDPTAFRQAAGRERRPAPTDRPDPGKDPEARIAEMEKLGFDVQVLITQNALPSPLRPQAEKPLWLRTALAQLYNNAGAELQKKYPDRFICMATIPWDDIDASVKELERASALGLKAVCIAGSYLDRNLDVYEL